MQVDSNDCIYLDYAAATPVSDTVLAAMQPYWQQLFYNPSSPYAPAVTVRRDYEAAKSRIARIIGAKKDEIIITAGATESINLAFAATSGQVVTSNIEHHAVLRAAEQRDYSLVTANAKGLVNADDVARALTPETRLVSIALVNNELGTVQPIRKIAAVIERERERRRSTGETTPLYFHSDGSQAAGHLDLHVSKLGLDMLTLNAAKVYGPKQVGLLWTATHVTLKPQIVGGGQERGFRSGTENVAGTIGFAAALEYADRHRDTEMKRLTTLRNDLETQLTAMFPEAVVSGDARRRLGNFLHISFPGVDAERLLFMLEARGVLVATGSACAANQGTRSHVLTAIGLEPQVADGSLRISLGRASDEQSMKRAGEHISQVVRQEYERTRR